MSLNNSLWKGVFSSFAEAGGDLDAFDSDIWINKQKNGIYGALQSLECGNFTSKDYPLPLVVAMMLTTQNELSVLDFGGGMGLQYLEIIAKVPEAKARMYYYVVDGNKSIKNVPLELIKFENLHFFSNFSDVGKQIDIIHIGSTLHYIEDWWRLLHKLYEEFNPKYFIFSDLLGGDIPTFVTHQCFYDKKIPVCMFNLKQIEDCMEKMLFYPIYKTLYETTILGCNELPNASIPESLRIKMTLNLIFVGKDIR